VVNRFSQLEDEGTRKWVLVAGGDETLANRIVENVVNHLIHPLFGSQKMVPVSSLPEGSLYAERPSGSLGQVLVLTDAVGMAQLADGESTRWTWSGMMQNA
jgi:hypothetical protein